MTVTTNYNTPPTAHNLEATSPFAGTWIGGIPGDIFAPGNPDERHEITMASGQQLSYRMSDRKIILTTAGQNPPYFHATQGEYRGEPSVNILCRTKYKDAGGHVTNTRQPDFVAKDLYDAAIEYFDFFSDRPVRYISSLWIEHDNYDAFHNHLKTMVPENPNGTYSESQKTEAAFSTWSGRQAQKHHFTEAAVTIDPSGVVRTIFKRPDDIYNDILAAAISLKIIGPSSPKPDTQ